MVNPAAEAVLLVLGQTGEPAASALIVAKTSFMSQSSPHQWQMKRSTQSSPRRASEVSRQWRTQPPSVKPCSRVSALGGGHFVAICTLSRLAQVRSARPRYSSLVPLL